MRYKFLAGAGLRVPQLSLGTLTFGGQADKAASFSMMDYAFEHGIDFFDTANSYAGGESERIVGAWLKGRRDKVKLASKVCNATENPRGEGLGRDNIIAACEDSLRRLGTDYIDLYYLHKPDYNTPLEETMETMTNLVKSGKVRYVGVSNFAAWQVADILAICDKRNYIPPVVSQNVYNLITRGVEAELVPFLDAHDMDMVAYNPIAAGLLTGKHKPGAPSAGTRFAQSEMYQDRYWSEENFAAVEKLTVIAAEHGMSLLQLAMKWCFSQKRTVSVLTGASKLEQLVQNIASIEGEPLSAEVLAKCDEVWKLLAGTRYKYNR